jgi:hypothetical protein
MSYIEAYSTFRADCGGFRDDRKLPPIVGEIPRIFEETPRVKMGTFRIFTGSPPYKLQCLRLTHRASAAIGGSVTYTRQPLPQHGRTSSYTVEVQRYIRELSRIIGELRPVMLRTSATNGGCGRWFREVRKTSGGDSCLYRKVRPTVRKYYHNNTPL